MKQFFQNLFAGLFGKRKKEGDWLKTARRDVAKPSQPLPLDPDNPWST